MRDHGLSEAIRKSGGVSELARRLGISQASVSNWARVPAERVAAVEGVTGVRRAVLRPDLFGESAVQPAVDEVDLARAREYALIAGLLARAPDAKLLQTVRELRADATPLGLAHGALAQAARDASAQQVEREYFDLFIGLGRGELLPYGSYYLTGFLHERPLARLRADLVELGIERVEGNPEPEDHAAILCEIMSGLVDGRFGTPHGSDRQLFEKHLAPWIGRFFADLERIENTKFYRALGTVGRVFTQIETEAFALPA